MKKRIRLHGILIFLASIIAVLLPEFVFSGGRQRIIDWFLSAAGVAMILCGFFFRVAARGYKEENTNAGKNLVKGGPYALIRNPMYFGTLLIGVGIILAVMRLWLLPLFWIIFLAIYIPQIKQEECLLSERFGQDYRNYCKITPRYFPAICLLSKPGSFVCLKWPWIKKELTSFALVLLLILAIKIWQR